MNGHLSPNSQSILLLTGPLIAGNLRNPTKPLSLGEYCRLARQLRETQRSPADLLNPGILDDTLSELRGVGIALDSGRVQSLLNRGFLLAQAMERWQARAIWVVTRADNDYPRRLKKRMGDRAPPVFYGCGDRAAMDEGGLAVVGSRRVNEDLIRYTEDVGRLAAEAEVAIVSGGARGVDQAAMRGALEAGGRALGVLANGLERAALNRENRAPLMDGRLVLVCPYDPSIRFLVGNAMQRNKLIYGLADAALVANSDHGHGGTWAGATEQLNRLNFVPVYVRADAEPSPGLDALGRLGAQGWPNPDKPEKMREIVAATDLSLPPQAEPAQRELFPAGSEVVPAVSTVRETAPAGGESKSRADRSAATSRDLPGQAPMRLLRAVSGEMSRKEIRHALGLRDWSNVKKRYLDPCLHEGWIEMTMPDRASSRNQRFRITPAGRTCQETFNDG